MGLEIGTASLEVIFQICQARAVAELGICVYRTGSIHYNEPPVEIDFVDMVQPSSAHQQVISKVEAVRKYNLSPKDGYGRIVGVISEVRMPPGSRHLQIPMMDFQGKDGVRLPARIQDQAEVALPGGSVGYVMDSGQSYHLIAQPPQLLSEGGWQNFLGRFAGSEDLVDMDFIRASLRTGYSIIRLDSFPPHKPQMPRLMGSFEVGKTTEKQSE